MTSHSNLCGSLRQHEMLNGLWAVGVKAYPIFGPFPDFKEPGMETTYREYENMGYSREDVADAMRYARFVRGGRPTILTVASYWGLLDDIVEEILDEIYE